MNSYILLRDNKESGPHSISDLQRIGLKANDLIWVECQSVSWRNPGEIGELKKLMSESTEPAIPVQAITTPIPEAEQVKVEEIPAQTETAPEPLVNKKSVFVSLPVNKTEAKPEVKVAREVTSVDKYKPVPVDDHREPAEPIEQPVETKYSRSLDEIKEMYVKNIEQRKTRPRRFSIKLPKQFAKAAIYLGLVLVGAVTVLLFKKTGGNMPTIAEQPSPLTTKIKERLDTFPETLNESSIIGETTTPAENIQSEQIKSEPAPKQEPFPDERKALTRENNTRATERNNNGDVRMVSDDPVSIPKNETPEIRKIPLESISSQVSVKTNSYTIAALGGIRNLELTLQNDSKYHLDKVTVELRYLNPAGIILKTEDIHFKAVDPNEAQTIPVKKTNRGVKVSYKITRIESKEIGGSTAGL